MTFVRSRSLFGWQAAFHAGLAAAAFVAAAVAVAPAVYGQAPADNTLTAAEQSAGWQLLFDGKTIDKWRVYNGTEHPGELVGRRRRDHRRRRRRAATSSASTSSATSSSRSTSRSPRTATAACFYRGVEAKGEPIYHSAPEYPGDRQRRPPGRQERPGPLLRRQLRHPRYPPQPASACKPAGEWNSARLIVKGAHVEHWLNGTKVVDYELWSEEVEGPGRGQQVQGVARLRHGRGRPPRPPGPRRRSRVQEPQNAGAEVNSTVSQQPAVRRCAATAR